MSLTPKSIPDLFDDAASQLHALAGTFAGIAALLKAPGAGAAFRTEQVAPKAAAVAPPAAPTKASDDSMFADETPAQPSLGDLAAKSGAAVEPAAPAAEKKRGRPAKAAAAAPAAEAPMTPGELAVATKAKFVSVATNNYDAVVELLGRFRAAKFSEVPPEKHAAFLAELQKVGAPTAGSVVE